MLVDVNVLEDLVKQLKSGAGAAAHGQMQSIFRTFDAIVRDGGADDKVRANALQNEALEYYVENFNPWKAYALDYLNNGPSFVLSAHDNRQIATHSEIKTNDLLPAPFTGGLDSAKLVVLLLNPGYDESGNDEKRVQNNTPFVNATLDNLQDPLGYNGGFTFLRPDYHNLVGGNMADKGDKWWRSFACGAGFKNPNFIASRVSDIHQWLMDIEMFPYASVRFKMTDYDIKSGDSWMFTKCLVRLVMGRGIPIVCRSYNRVSGNLLPELKDYAVGGNHPNCGRLFVCPNVQRVSMSAGNMQQVGVDTSCAAAFAELVRLVGDK